MQHVFISYHVHRESQDYTTCTGYTPSTRICKHECFGFLSQSWQDFIGFWDQRYMCLRGHLLQILLEGDVYRLYQHQSIISYEYLPSSSSSSISKIQKSGSWILELDLSKVSHLGRCCQQAQEHFAAEKGIKNHVEDNKRRAIHT